MLAGYVYGQTVASARAAGDLAVDLWDNFCIVKL
jgi:hypothetical protein